MVPLLLVLLMSSGVILFLGAGCSPEHSQAILDNKAAEESSEFDTNNPNTEDSQEKMVQREPTFEYIFTNIIAPKCLRCHEPGNAKDGIDLSTYDNILFSFSSLPTVVPERPEVSGAYVLMKSGEMPKEGEPVDPEDIEMVRQWILNGALEN